MYKKSITRIDNENDSSQADLSSPALQDIIATNHVVLAKKPREERLSRACKALIIMIILALVAAAIIVLTLVLAHSRNTLMAIISRSTEGNFVATTNHSRFLFINQENSTMTTNEQTEYENKQTTSTVSLTSYNLPTFTTSNVHISSSSSLSSVMRTEQENEEHTSSTIQSPSMKPYPSTNTIFNDQSTSWPTTIQTTVSNQPPSTTYHQTTMMMMITTTTQNQLIISTKHEEDIPIVSSDKPTIVQEQTTSLPEETSSFTTFLNRYFDLQTSTKNQQNFRTNISNNYSTRTPWMIFYFPNNNHQ